jgi:Transposase
MLYGWKSKYGGMEVGEAQRLKGLEDENRRLKELVADLSLDKEARERELVCDEGMVEGSDIRRLDTPSAARLSPPGGVFGTRITRARWIFFPRHPYCLDLPSFGGSLEEMSQIPMKNRGTVVRAAPQSAARAGGYEMASPWGRCSFGSGTPSKLQAFGR